MQAIAESEIFKILRDLFNDLFSGTSSSGSWVLNREDSGLLKSLNLLSSEQASKVPITGGASIAAHVEHLRYGFNFLNRWRDAGDEQAVADADFSAAWRRNAVSDEEWTVLRNDLAREALAWRDLLDVSKDGAPGMDGKFACVVHLAYHVGAIRQIDRTLRGPAARG